MTKKITIEISRKDAKRWIEEANEESWMVLLDAGAEVLVQLRKKMEAEG